MHLLLPLRPRADARLADRQRAHLGPLPMYERHHGAIHTQHQAVGSTGWQRVGLQDGVGRTGLEPDSCCPGGLGQAASGGAVDLNLSEEGKLADRFGEGGNMGAQADQTLLQARRELARQQAQFVIEGEKARSRRRGRLHSCVRG